MKTPTRGTGEWWNETCGNVADELVHGAMTGRPLPEEFPQFDPAWSLAEAIEWAETVDLRGPMLLRDLVDALRRAYAALEEIIET